MAERIRPSFKDPPLAEVVCGIQFRPLTEFQAPHYGIFWEQIRKDFPRCRTVTPLAAGQDLQLQANEPTEITLQVLANAPDMPRVWFISNDDTYLVQLQPDRLLLNWREGPARAPYPRFETIIGRFQKIYETFNEFLALNSLGDLALLNLELTYINHIRFGAGFESFSDIGEVFPDYSWRRDKRYVSAPEAFQFRSNHSIPNGGKLSVSIGAARDRKDKSPLVRFDLTARGSAIASDGTGDIWKWYRSANEWIVDSFVDLTSEKMQHEIWKREDKEGK
jgi:uncharacterized protein (TIGR04255 family)